MSIVQKIYFSSYKNTRFYFTKLSNIVLTSFLKIHYRLYGIQLGKNCKFFGLPKIVKKGNGRIKIGNNCTFRSNSTSNLIGINHKCIISTLKVGAQIIIGDGCGFSGTVIGSEKRVILGNHVRCGANTIISDSDYHSDDPRSGPPKEVVIEDNVWLGVNTVVLKGVTIGKNSLIGANSVVTKNIPENVIAAGNPCKVIRIIK